MAHLIEQPGIRALSSIAVPLNGALAYVFDAGTSTPRATYPTAADAVAHTNPQANPLPSNSVGVFAPMYLDPAGGNYKLDIRSSAGVSLSGYPIDNLEVFNPEDIVELINGRTEVEAAASVTPINFASWPSPWYDISRVVTDNTGATDQTAGFLDAFKSAGTGSYRGEVIIPSGAYKISSSLVFGTAANNAKPLVVRGSGQSTQIINACSAGKPTFNMSGVKHWHIMDLLLTGNSTNLNDAIRVNDSGHQGIRWLIERVVSQMPGRGIVLENTNTGVIRDFKHWPDSNDNSLTVAQTVTSTDIDHGIYATGSFAHNVTIYDADCFPQDIFKAGAAGIKWDTSGASHGVVIIGGMAQGNAGMARNGIWLKNCTSYTVLGVYHESSVLRFEGCSQGTIIGCNNGAVEGKILLLVNSGYNSIIGCTSSLLDINDSSCNNNTVFGGVYVSGITDNAAPTTRFFNVSGRGADRGGNSWSTVTYSASMTPDCRNGKQFNVVPNNGTAFTFNEPTNSIDGDVVLVKIRNGTGGALGALTWGAQYRATNTTQPIDGHSVIRTFTQDKSYGSGVLWIQTGANVDVLN